MIQKAWLLLSTEFTEHPGLSRNEHKILSGKGSETTASKEEAEKMTESYFCSFVSESEQDPSICV